MRLTITLIAATVALATVLIGGRILPAYLEIQWKAAAAERVVVSAIREWKR